VFKNPKNHFAAQLIESSGLKGYCIGGACVSEKHANYIINQNNATAMDIEKLIAHIQDTIKQKFNIELETEIIII
jgi:UDP-N-acetylmuramate dehydrogenase